MVYSVRVLPTNDTKIQVIGSIIAALVGAVIGAVAAYVFSEIGRKKQVNANEVNETRLKIRASQRAVNIISAHVHSSLIVVLKNLQHYEILANGILDENNMLIANITLPLPYRDLTGSFVDVLNNQLVENVLSYENELILQNININELNNYYSELLKISHAIVLQGGNLKPQVIAADNTGVIKGANDLTKACESFYDRCITLMAYMELYAEQYEVIDFTTVKLIEVKRYMDKLVDFAPDKKDINKKRTKLKKTYTKDKAFLVA